MQFRKRIFILLGFFLVFHGLVVLRLFYWQVLKADELTVLANGQSQDIKKITASRGEIITADDLPLVTNRNAYLLYANPGKIDPEKKDFASQELAKLLYEPLLATESSENKQKYLKEKASEIAVNLSYPDRVWVPIKHQLTDDEKQSVEKLALPGLGFENETVRYYPEASMAASLTGFVGSNLSGDPTGYFGLEGFYDMELRGRDGLVVSEKDAGNVPVLNGIFTTETKKDGKTLRLSIDRTVQGIVEDELTRAIQKYGAKSGWVIVMDPSTGAILSLAANPSYSQGNFSDYPAELYKNPAISEAYEPGSTFKVLVMSSALNENLVTPQSTCEICTGPYPIDKYFIRTWNEKYYPGSTMTEVIQHSDNIGMVWVGQKLGKEKMLKYLKKFGIGEKTGIDLQEESWMPLKKDDSWNDVDLATASFGQGLVVTGIEMASAVSAIANGGDLMEPHVVSEIFGDGKSLKIQPKLVRHILDKRATGLMSQMMVNAVDNGEAKWAKPKGFTIAGKTGTAQIAISGHYDDKKTIASFVGFAPVPDPKFLALVYLREPTSSPWGSETAAPLFFAIAKRLFLYYGIQPG